MHESGATGSCEPRAGRLDAAAGRARVEPGGAALEVRNASIRLVAALRVYPHEEAARRRREAMLPVLQSGQHPHEVLDTQLTPWCGKAGRELRWVDPFGFSQTGGIVVVSERCIVSSLGSPLLGVIMHYCSVLFYGSVLTLLSY